MELYIWDGNLRKRKNDHVAKLRIVFERVKKEKKRIRSCFQKKNDQGGLSDDTANWTASEGGPYRG